VEVIFDNDVSILDRFLRFNVCLRLIIWQLLRDRSALCDMSSGVYLETSHTHTHLTAFLGLPG